MTVHPDVARFGRLLGGAERSLLFTGAGISTASGIPDYRGPRGVWRTRQPVFYDDFLARKTARVEYWHQKLEDREALARATPNSVHRAIARLDAAGRVEAVVTQNVDGLHAASGLPVERQVELHGTTREVECQSCHDRSDPAPHFANFAESGEPPRCDCGGWLKPATISFGQSLRRDDIERSVTAAERCDLVVSIGSTLAVTPAADIPLAAARRGSPYVIVNRGPTEHDLLPSVTLRIDGDVNAIVPEAVELALRG